MTRDDETAISEITILPDGRVYVFGMSRQVLEVLQCLQTGDQRMQRLHEHLGSRCEPEGLATGLHFVYASGSHYHGD